MLQGRKVPNGMPHKCSFPAFPQLAKRSFQGSVSNCHALAKPAVELEPSWAAVERVSGEQACISAVGDETRRTATADIPPPLSHPFLSMLLVLSDARKISLSQPPLVPWRSYFSLPFPSLFSIQSCLCSRALCFLSGSRSLHDPDTPRLLWSP